MEESKSYHKAATTTMTSEGTNEVARNVPPTLDRPKQQLPTLRMKRRKIASNVSSTSDRNNRQQRVSVVAPQRRQYGLIPTFGQYPRRRHTTPSATTTNSQIAYNHDDDDDDDHNKQGNAEFDDDTIDHYIANTVESLETYIAIQSLQQSIETSITVPLALGSTGTTTASATTATFHHIRGVLECQIFEYCTPVPSSSSSSFATSSSKHDNTLFSNQVTVNDLRTNQKCSVSKQKILKQLQHLQQQNVITCIPIVQGETSHNFYLFTKDYIQYIEQQQQIFGKETSKTTSVDTASQSEIILQWWLRQLRSKRTIRTQGRASYLTVHDFEQALYHDPPRHSSDSVQSQQRHSKSSSSTTTTTLPLSSASMIIQHLQNVQLILSASYDHCTYQLWLPTVWGTMVLPKFSQLCKDVILYIKRSSYHERSMASILERFHNHPAQQRPLITVPSAKRIRGTTFTAKGDTDIDISIPHVIIPYLVSQRRIQRIERPSGMFLTFIE